MVSPESFTGRTGPSLSLSLCLLMYVCPPEEQVVGAQSLAQTKWRKPIHRTILNFALF